MEAAAAGKGTVVLTLWDYLLALLVLVGTGALVWFIVAPRDRSWMPDELRAADEAGTSRAGDRRLSA